MKRKCFTPVLLISFQSLSQSFLNMKTHVIVSALSIHSWEIPESSIIKSFQYIVFQLVHIIYLIDFTYNWLLGVNVVSDINLTKWSLSNLVLDFKLLKKQDMLILQAVRTLLTLYLKFFLWLDSFNRVLIILPFFGLLSHIFYEFLPFLYTL